MSACVESLAPLLQQTRQHLPLLVCQLRQHRGLLTLLLTPQGAVCLSNPAVQSLVQLVLRAGVAVYAVDVAAHVQRRARTHHQHCSVLVLAVGLRSPHQSQGQHGASTTQG
jgi:hypothetical protein